MRKFLTITVFGERGRYGAQVPGIDAPVWGNSPDELATALAGAIQRLTATAKRDLFTPLLDEAAQSAG